MSVNVTTQAELDQALADGADVIYIDSPVGVWLTLSSSGSARVVASGSAHVVARGSAHVVAWDSAHVEARPYVAVHLHSARATVEGGVVIDIASLDLTDPAVWCGMQGVDITDGRAVVYKAVNDDLRSEHGNTNYPLGGTVTAPDWRNDGKCGGGLHFGPTPKHAQAYNSAATRFLACSIPVDAACGIPGGTAKIKARECVVLYEVDVDGKPIEAVVS